MALEFDNNPYYSVAIKNSSDFQDKVEKSLKYQYVQVDYDKFSEKFKQTIGRDHRKESIKKAFPGAILAIAAIISHLAKLIFIEMPKAIVKKNHDIKIHYFYIKRNFQELKGRFLSIFSDCRGSFEIEESEFHKKCYDYYLINRSIARKDELYKKLAEEHIEKGQLNQALFVCENINNVKEKQLLLYQLIRSYVNKNLKLECLGIIKKFSINNDEFLNEMVNIAIKHHNFDLANALTDNVQAQNIQNLQLIFEYYLKQKNFIEAEKLIGKINDSTIKDNFLKALSIARLENNVQAQNIQKLQLIFENYLKQQNFIEAEKLIGKINDSTSKDNFLEKLSKACLENIYCEKDIDFTLSIILKCNLPTKDILLESLVFKSTLIDIDVKKIFEIAKKIDDQDLLTKAMQTIQVHLEYKMYKNSGSRSISKS